MTPLDVPPSPTSSDGHPSPSTTHSDSTGPLLPDELHTLSCDESPSDWSPSDQSDRSEDEGEDDDAGFDMVGSREFHPASEGGRSSLSTASHGSSSASSGRKSADERMKLSYPDPMSSVEEFAPLSPMASPPPSPALPAEKIEAKEIKNDLENSILHDGGTYSLLLDAPVPSSPSPVASLQVAASTTEPPRRDSETSIASSATFASPLLRAQTNDNGPEKVSASALATTKYDAENIGRWVRSTSAGSEKKPSPSTSLEASQADQHPASVTSSHATVVPAAFASVLSISPSEKEATGPVSTADGAVEVETNEKAVAAALETKPKPAPTSRSTIPDKLDEIASTAGRKSLMSRTMFILTAAGLVLAAAGMMETNPTLSALMHGHVAVAHTTGIQTTTRLAIVAPETVTLTVTTVTSYAAPSDASTSTSSSANATSSAIVTASASSSDEKVPSSSAAIADQSTPSSSPAPSACAPCPSCDTGVLPSPSPIFAPRPRPNRRSAGANGTRPSPFYACRGSDSEQEQEKGRSTLATHHRVNKHGFSSTDDDRAAFDRAFAEALRTISFASKGASRRIQKRMEEVLEKVSRLCPPTVLALHGAHERASTFHDLVRREAETFLLHSHHHGKHEFGRARRAAERLATSLRKESARLRNRPRAIAEESARALASQLGLAKTRFAKGAPAMQQRAREAAQGLVGFGTRHVRRAARTSRKLARRAERRKAKRELGKQERAGRGR
ncbi:hypothetical protein JCM1840_000374 [Sporobolomyces johnsonii]